MKVYHTSSLIITHPDLTHGRKNADFGQGFYMSLECEFASRWARKNKDILPVINVYELNLDDLNVHTFERNEEWYQYLYENRSNQPDSKKEIDVIIGPIANDTIYDTFGITTSGLLTKEDSLKLLDIGPIYHQVVLTTEKAFNHLHWKESEEIREEDLLHFQEVVKEEEKNFQEKFVEIFKQLSTD